MKGFVTVLLVGGCVILGILAWKQYPEVKGWVRENVVSSTIQTLEVRYSAESIMESHKKELLADKNHSFLEPDLKFHPYLLMEVKYNRSKDKTVEGVILWSLVDGEMVLDTKTWEQTHGFTDCLDSRADREDFKIIHALAKGPMDKEALAKKMNVEIEVLSLWLEKCKAKNLIVQIGAKYRLHLQNPKILVTPETKLVQWLVTKTSHVNNRIAKKFRESQVIQLAKASFGNDFTIRKTTEIFLPVYSISVQNPDGSQMTSYWNALNGQRFSKTLHVE